jgi:hypothetical protein
MNPMFSEITEGLEPLFKQLLNMLPVQAGSLRKIMPIRGIYLFSEDGKHLYVGRSNNIKRRIGRHSRSGATYRMAAFVFHLARQAAGF